MVLSVNTNQGAFLALQNLTKTTRDLEVTQLSSPLTKSSLDEVGMV